MGVYFLWGSIGVLVLFLLIGFFAGLIRGLKRASLHILFVLTSLFVSFFITKPIANALLGINIEINGQMQPLREILVGILNLSPSLQTANSFLERVPLSIISPIAFIIISLLVWLLFEIIYLIVARVSFGKKKADFLKNKPYRWYGSLLGIFEGFVFLVMLFAPITALTKTYQEIVSLDSSQIQSTAITDIDLPTISEAVEKYIPKEVNEAIKSYNDCVIGKIAGAGGLDKALFDGLSNFTFEKEKISIRKEILNLATSYNDFTSVYQNIKNKTYPKDIDTLQKDFEKVTDGGLFKSVLSPTIKEYLDSDEFKTKTFDQQIIKEILNSLQKKFESVDVFEYLQHDISKILTAANNAFKSGIIEDITNINETDSTKKILKILEIINEKNKGQNEIKPNTIIDNVLELNIVSDSFEPIIKFASDKVADALKNDKDIIFALNTQIKSDNIKNVINETLNAADRLLNAKLNILDLINLNEKDMDILEYLNSLEGDVGEMLDEAGTVLDSLRGLEIFKYSIEEKEQNFFDNFLKLNDLELLKDNVIDGSVDGQKDGKLTYTEFFAYIKKPVVEAKEIGLLNINAENFDLKTILVDKVFPKLDKENPNYLSSILLPFKDLTVFDLNKIAFEDIITKMEEIEMFNFKAEGSAEWNDERWKTEFSNLEKVLITLNDKGKGTVGDKSFAEYLLTTENADMNDVLKQMPAQTLEEVVDELLNSTIFRPLVNKIFKAYDEAIISATKTPEEFKFETVTTDVFNQKEEVGTILKSILKIAINNENISLTDIGKILDLLKVNAQKKGIFFDSFANMIWYMTGDDLTEGKYNGKVPENDKYQDIKKYITDSQTELNYYEVDYEKTMTMFEMAKDISDNLDIFKNKFGGELNDTNVSENVEEFTSSVTDVIDELLTEKTTEEVQDVVESLDSLIKDNEDISDLLGDSLQNPETKQQVSGEIDKYFAEKAQEGQNYDDLADALKSLLGLK